ncbi:hypothetical protein DK842_06365 [Chromobacterium phragmitis]|uniref:DUF3106 domain-containing protein n=1 Tax=Chromobacterium phragmitis TaxID=2202141 RepID=A0A344UI37_9NEIS|nr:DUF3106 domain-containing protein [Chromobacterium phragmitis]AXE29559.1 hypothetical protein DK842_06365 [Chromobacterium phragmitis]AXE34935.1 hypothetical protein DK843_11880 [Chromobacterium phragmitis]
MSKAKWLAGAFSLACLLTPRVSLATPLADPRWEQLNGEQQQVLAPLASDWNRFAPDKKQDLLTIVPRFAELTPSQQQRLQRRLKAWTELSEQQRDEIRANWKKLQQLPPEQREQALRRLRARAVKPTSASAP